MYRMIEQQCCFNIKTIKNYAKKKKKNKCRRQPFKTASALSFFSFLLILQTSASSNKETYNIYHNSQTFPTLKLFNQVWRGQKGKLRMQETADPTFSPKTTGFSNSAFSLSAITADALIFFLFREFGAAGNFCLSFPCFFWDAFNWGSISANRTSYTNTHFIYELTQWITLEIIE